MPDNSRKSQGGAGWGAHDAGVDERRTVWLDRRIRPKWDSFSWITVRALLESINDVVAKGGPRIIPRARERWVAHQMATGIEHPQPGVLRGRGSFGPDFVVDWTSLAGRPARFLLVGDPGEADASQYATIEPLLHVHREGIKPSDFMVIVSDVVYPAGDVNEYVNAFYLPYSAYDAPIYALPGNHDWYDGLNGFMYHFCAAEPLPPESFIRWSYKPGDQAAMALWRGAAQPRGDELASWMAERRRLEAGPPTPGGPEPPLSPPRRPRQPAPYFALDLGDLLLVAIDTGVDGTIDADQGAWLRRVSRRRQPKVLLTGKPIYVENEYHPGQISWDDHAPEYGLTVDDIVRDPDHSYVAAVGGDIHNYQRYPVRLTDGRTLQYIVSGGGGAFLSATHPIPQIGPTEEHQLPPDVEGFGEEGFRCYPLRGDSLALFTRQIGSLLFKLVLSTLVFVTAAAVELALVLDGDKGRWWPILLTALLPLAVVGGFFAGFVRPAIAFKLPRGLRGIAFLGFVTVAASIAVSTLFAIENAATREAVAITIALPLLGLIGVLVAYNVRGSSPEQMPVVLMLVPPIVAYEYLLGFSLGDVGDGFVYLLIPATAALLAMVWLERRRRRIVAARNAVAWGRFKWAVGLSWLAGTIGLFTLHGDWLWQTLLVLAVAGLAIVEGIPRLSRREPRPTTETYGLGGGPSALIGLGLLTLALLVMEAIEHRLALDTAAALVAIPAVPSVMVWLGLVLLLRGNPWALWRMRTGAIDPDYAAQIMREHLGIATQIRAPFTGTVRRGEGRMVKAVRALGKQVSELGDSNEPPFYKHFLSVELVGGELTITCHGVTGATSEPTVEDRVTITLPASTPGAGAARSASR